MNADEFPHTVWCDLEIAFLRIHSYTRWDTKMVRTAEAPDTSKPVVNVYLCREDDDIFQDLTLYRERQMARGLYRGHHFGEPGRLKYVDALNVALFHPDPGMIIWSLVIKYVLTVFALRAGILHLKAAAVAYRGMAFVILGRGGAGKTEMVKVLCANGARLVSNTHLLVDGLFVCGIKSNMRVRSDAGDVYEPVDQHPGLAASQDWLPLGGVFWMNYRTDGENVVQRIPPDVAKANMQYFSEGISNWELKEDVADYFRSDPFQFGECMNLNNQLLQRFSENTAFYHANLDVFSHDGIEKLTTVMDAEPDDRYRPREGQKSGEH